jgi:hypothetical protein
LRGELSQGDFYIGNIEEYIPMAHVQFLEQAAIKVVPISFKLSEEDLVNKLRQVNGLYICGDS